jgi:twitching motility protein PilT
MFESIDNLLGILHSQNGRELRFEVGQHAKLVTDSGAFDLSPNPLAPADIRNWAGPIIPPEARQTLTSQASVDFDYDCSGIGTFKVRVVRTGGAMSFVFTPGGSGAGFQSDFQPPATSVAQQPAAPGQSGALRTPSGALRPPSGALRPPSGPLRTTGSLADGSSQRQTGALSQGSGPLRQTGALGEPQPRAAGGSGPLSAEPRRTGPLSQQPAAVSSAEPGVKVSAGSLTMDRLFRQMFEAGSSDLHMSVSMPPMVRRDGQMMPLDPSHPRLSPEDTQRLLSSIIPPKNTEEFRQRNDTDFAHEIPDLARFRANIFRDRKGMGGVFRVIPNQIMTAEDLKLSQQVLKLCQLNKGLVLVTGPTGSGKSTTLCALIDYINRNRSDHIITIEDPIEFVHENKKCLINQREVHNHTDSFRDALRAALREDPDIVLVGEMRDLETVAIAIETAETGHLVFGTLHTTTATSTVDRIIDQFPPDRQTQIRIMLSESLRGVISQTLLKKVGGGRVAALEILIANSAVSNLIREAKTFQLGSIMQTQRNLGNVMLNDALISLVNKKMVTPEEAYSKSIDKPGFETLLKRNNVDISFIVQSAA